MTRGLFPHVLESIHKTYLLFTQHLITRGSEKQQRRGWDYSKQKEKLFQSHKNYVLFGVISPCITLPCLFQKRPSSFLHFGQVKNIHGTYLKKNFLICFSLLSPQAEQKEDDEHFANHLQIHVSRTFTIRPKNLYYAHNTK